MAYRGSQYVRLGGGLDLRSSAMQMASGRLLYAVNVECVAPNGYKRIDGYEIKGAEITGSGSITGVTYYNSTTYALRANAGGTAVVMWKLVAGTWTEVDLGREVAFTSGGTTAISVGDTVVGATSGATAVVRHVQPTSGLWVSGNVSGWLTLYGQTGTFQAEDLNIQGGATNVATIAADSTAVTLSTGGKYDFDIYNFNGTDRLYGADGVNNAFEFDGSYYIKIRTGMVSDNPSHVVGYKNHLFLSFAQSVQFSPINNPTGVWSVVLGAGELLVKGTVTSFMHTPTGALAVMSDDGVFILEGSSSQDFTGNSMREYGNHIGAKEWTVQQMGSRLYWLSDQGVVELSAAQQYGEFQDATLTQEVQPIIDRYINAAVGSAVLKSKNQYWLAWNDGRGMIISFYRDRPLGITEFNLPDSINCMWSGDTATDGSRIFFGSTGGKVFEFVEDAPSFAGADIVATMKTAFTSLGSPRVIKRWRHVVFDLNAPTNSPIQIKPDFRFSNDGVPAYSYSAISLYGAGTPLGTGTLGTTGSLAMVLGGSYLVESVVEIPGRGDYCSMVVNSTSSVGSPWIISGMIYEFLPGRRRY